MFAPAGVVMDEERVGFSSSIVGSEEMRSKMEKLKNTDATILFKN